MNYEYLYVLVRYECYGTWYEYCNGNILLVFYNSSYSILYIFTRSLKKLRLRAGTYQNYYSWEQYSWCIHESRAGHTSNAQIHCLSEPAIQCSRALYLSLVFSLSLVSFLFPATSTHSYVPTYMVQLVHNPEQLDIIYFWFERGLLQYTRFYCIKLKTIHYSLFWQV